MRYFKAATGPCAEEHYALPAVGRLPKAAALAREGRYFVVHAPPRTGKTTTMNALVRLLIAERRHVALRFSCESGDARAEDYGTAELQILGAIGRSVRLLVAPEFQPPDAWPDTSPGTRLVNGLQDWAMACPLPLVLIFDDIDALPGRPLISVLSQLRDGFSRKPDAFPHSVILCGAHDITDHRFNVAVESLRIGDFTAEEVAVLYKQRTEETGQEFTPEAAERAFEYSQGQPWLVNALAYEVTQEMGVQPPETITADHIDTAKERLIQGKRTHLSSLSAKLHEPRVRRFVEPFLAGAGIERDTAYDDDLNYVRDLGLIARDRPIRISNPIYREVIARVLSAGVQDQVTLSPQRFVLPDGRLDFRTLLEEFAVWWVENGEFMTRTEVYHEAAVQLVFMGFLQRIVNGGGFVDREYGVGRGRIDILVRKPYGDHQMQREAIEIKAWSKGKEPLEVGLKQLDGYLDQFGLDAGTLIIFDRRKDAPDIAERTALSHITSPAGREITLLRA